MREQFDLTRIQTCFSFDFVPLLCYHKPEIMKRLHVSGSSFCGGYFTFFYGPSMLPGSVSDMNFHLTNLSKMGFVFVGLSKQGLIGISTTRSELVPSVINGINKM